MRRTNNLEYSEGVLSTVWEVLCLCFIAVLFVFVQSEPITFDIWWSRTQIYIPVSAFSVWIFATNKGILTRLLTCGPLVWIGDLSAFAFLTHQVVIRYCSKVCERLSYSNTLLIISIEFVITLASAWIAEKALSRTSKGRRCTTCHGKEY